MYILSGSGIKKGELAQTGAHRRFFVCMECVTCSSDLILSSPYFMPPGVLYFYNCLHFCIVVIFYLKIENKLKYYLVSYLQIVMFLFYVPR